MTRWGLRLVGTAFVAFASGCTGRADPGPATYITRYGVGRGDKWVGAVINIQVRPLGAFEEDLLSGLNRLIDDNGDIATWNGYDQEYSYDAWGRRRNPENWSYTLESTDFMELL